MTGTIVLALSLLAQLGSGDVVSPIGPTSGNTTSGGTGGLDRSDANLEDSHPPFTSGAAPISTGSESTGSGSSTSSSPSSTGSTGSTSSGTAASMPLGAGGTGTSGGITSGTGIGGSSMR